MQTATTSQAFIDGDEVQDRQCRRGRVSSTTPHFVFVRFYERGRLIADPGIGFGKSFRHNLDLLHQFTLFHGLGVPLLMGLSRKGFVGALTGEKTAANRVNGSIGGGLWSVLNGSHILRVHDVKATVEALAVVLACADPEASGL